jgi:radical SAM superfamily enzyme YgiQ (UPF0313 family)
LAPGYLSAYAKADPRIAAKVEFHISNLRPNDDRAAWLARMKAAKPGLIGFSCYIWNIREILSLARAVRKELPGVFVLFGGPDVGPRAAEVLADHPEVDAVAIGEGEETFAEVVKVRLLGLGELEGVAGLAFRGPRGVVVNALRPPIADVDRIPSPYRAGTLNLDDSLMACLETHRGCGFACHFCFYHKSYGGTRYFSLERVRSDLALIMSRKKGSDPVFFMDPTFNENPRRTKEVCRMIAEMGSKLEFSTEIRAELVDEELAVLMKKARVSYFEVGLQSADAGVLKGVHRAWKEDPFLRGIRLLNKYGFRYQLQLIMGLPGETLEGFLSSVRYAISLNPPRLGLALLQLLPGTHLRQHSTELGIEYHRDAPYLMIRSPDMSAEEVTKGRWVLCAVVTFYDWLPRTAGMLMKECGLDAVGLGLEFQDWAKTEGLEPPVNDYLSPTQKMWLRFIDSFCRRRSLDSAFYVRFAQREWESILSATARTRAGARGKAERPRRREASLLQGR